MNILLSCLLTLFACIYTALHLDVPTKTAWHSVLLSKLGWVVITLFAPEISVYMAADQLHQVWKLKSDLCAIRDKDDGPGRMNFDIDLRYCFFIVMGGVYVDVDGILSTPDLDHGVFDHKSKPEPFSVRLNPKAVVHLAERGNWIPISGRKIDGKSKANVLQKILVIAQVLWMVVQCIARTAYDLPLSLLEIHTMVHVVCALLLYICWFKKPLDVQDPEVVDPKEFKGEVAILLQRQFYAQSSHRLALFPPKKSSEQPPPDFMRWVESTAGSELMHGDVLPSGLGLLWSDGYYSPSITLTKQFLSRWEAILTAYPFENRAELARSTKPLSWLPFTSTTQPLALAHLKEFLSPDTYFYRDMPFGEGKRNIDINFRGPNSLSESFIATFENIMIRTFWLEFPGLLALAIALSTSYGGVHLSAWNFEFACHIEEVLWKISCICVAGIFPTFLVFELSLMMMNSYLGSGPEEVPVPLYYTKVGISGVVVVIYVASRVFIIAEAFLSLRHIPVGVYISPPWIQIIPHA